MIYVRLLKKQRGRDFNHRGRRVFKWMPAALIGLGVLLIEKRVGLV